ncbi:MAG: hypothetical protein KAT05_12060 [Spirochaetes bacterium]|nr:hypothetical protein [Spirochaetota bacterium]
MPTRLDYFNYNGWALLVSLSCLLPDSINAGSIGLEGNINTGCVDPACFVVINSCW